jgi:hypothetical protein
MNRIKLDNVEYIDIDHRLGDDAKFINLDSAAALECVEDDAWDAIVAGTIELNGGDAPGIDVHCVFSFDATLAGWEDARENEWRERGQNETLDLCGYAARKYANIQVRKGWERTSVLVIQTEEGCLTLH